MNQGLPMYTSRRSGRRPSAGTIVQGNQHNRSGPDHGEIAEDAVERILAASYLADFVVRSPKYEKAKVEKEAADLLLPFGDNLLCFQVKSRQVPTENHALDKDELTRLERRVDHAIDQVKAIREALRNGDFTEVVNIRGIAIPIRLQTPPKITGIAVLDIQHPQEWSEDERVAVFGGIGEVQGITVHVFLAQDFELIARELDTLPDLFRYLSVREELMRRRLLFPLTAEKDFLAIYISKFDLVERCLAGGVHLLPVAGAWDGLFENGQAQIAKRTELKSASRIFDSMVEKVHKCIGFNPGGNSSTSGLPTDLPASRAASAAEYFQIALELSRVHRADRIIIGEKIIEKAKRADSNPSGFSYFAGIPKLGGPLVVFLASRLERLDRNERGRFLWNLSAAAYVKFEPKILVGIAAQNFSAKSGSQDFLLMGDGTQFENQEELLELATGLFRESLQYSSDEWGNDYGGSGGKENAVPKPT